VATANISDELSLNIGGNTFEWPALRPQLQQVPPR